MISKENIFFEKLFIVTDLVYLNAGLFLSLLNFLLFSKNMSFRNTSRFSNSMDPDNAQHFSLNLASAVDKVYQRNILNRQIFDALEV